MNRSELSNRIVAWTHRSDLGSQVDFFIDTATARLNKRLGLALTLTGPSGENTISRDYPEIYLYAALREFAIYTADAPAAQSYEALYQEEVAQLNINAESEGFTKDTPAMKSEYEQAVEEANAT